MCLVQRDRVEQQGGGAAVQKQAVEKHPVCELAFVFPVHCEHGTNNHRVTSVPASKTTATMPPGFLRARSCTCFFQTLKWSPVWCLVPPAKNNVSMVSSSLLSCTATQSCTKPVRSLCIPVPFTAAQREGHGRAIRLLPATGWSHGSGPLRLTESVLNRVAF